MKPELEKLGALLSSVSEVNFIGIASDNNDIFVKLAGQEGDLIEMISYCLKRNPNLRRLVRESLHIADSILDVESIQKEAQVKTENNASDESSEDDSKSPVVLSIPTSKTCS